MRLKKMPMNSDKRNDFRNADLTERSLDRLLLIDLYLLINWLTERKKGWKKERTMDGWMNWRKDVWKSERTGGGFDGLMDYSLDVKITSLFLILLYRLLVHWQPNKLQLPARIMKLQGKIDKGNIHRTASWNRNFINTIMSSCVVTWISRTSQCIFHDWLTDWKIINQGNYSGN